jgi:integrase
VKVHPSALKHGVAAEDASPFWTRPLRPRVVGCSPAAGLVAVTPHDLRHMAASLAIAAVADALDDLGRRQTCHIGPVEVRA